MGHVAAIWWGELWESREWCLYDATNGNIILKRPYVCDEDVPCPRCGKILEIESYRAHCCGVAFSTGWNEIRQLSPVGTHSKQRGRGWDSLRVFKGDEDVDPYLGDEYERYTPE